MHSSVNNTIVTDDVVNCDNTEYSIHKLVKVVDGEHKNYWILVKRSRIGK